MSDLQTRLQQAAEEAAGHGRTPGPDAAIRRGGQRRRRLIGGTASLIALVLLAGTLGVDRLTSRPTPLAPATSSTSAPPPTSVTAVTPLDVEVHAGPFQGADPAGMVRDVTGVIKRCGGATGKPEVRAWAQVLGKWWLLAAKPPLPGKDWLCSADGLMEGNGAGGIGTRGGPSERLKPLQASGASTGVAGNRLLGVVSGTVTKQAARLRVFFHEGRPLDLVPVDAGNRFPVNFYAGFWLQPAPERTKQLQWMVARVVAYDEAGRRIAECRAMLGPGNTC
jgi:hypothetical protein